MKNTKNTLTINGKVYDATTGQPVAISKTSLPPVRIAQTLPIGAAPRKGHQLGTTATAIHSKQHHSSTLMRKAVKPVVPSRLPRNAQRSSATVSLKRTAAIEQNHQAIVAERLKRAQAVNQSQFVSHFGSNSNHVMVKRQAPIHVKRAPVLNLPPPAAPQPPKSPKDVLLESALLRATSHEQPAHKLAKRPHRFTKRIGAHSKFLGFSVVLVIILIGGGFFAHENAPRIALDLAGSRAGVHATLPHYQPAGVAMVGAHYSPGEVNVAFGTPKTTAYLLTQQNTSWDSTALQTNYVANAAAHYQTYVQDNHTLFVYNGLNVTWVNKGIWYNIKGEADLSTDQLLRIANSFQ